MAKKIVNGLEVNYQVVGDGVPLLILHGWGSNSTRWQDVANKITEKGFKVIVPDLPGFGETTPLSVPWNMNNYIKWLEAFVREMNLGEFYLAGHSFGGALACKYAIGHPQAVKKLFLLSAASIRTKTTKKSAYKNLAKIVKIFAFVPGYALFRKAFYKFIIRRSDYPYVDGVMKETYKSVIFEDLSQFTGFIKVPTILIWGDKDKSTPIEDAQFMNKKIRNSKLITIAGFGHALNKDCPEILAESILSNINE